MEIVIITLLILLNGFFSLSEIALISSKKIRLEQLKNEHSKGAKYALKLLDNSENFLSSIQVGITLIGIITGFYGGISLAKYFTPLFDCFNMTTTTAYAISVVISIAIITFFSIVLGELVPKTIALSKPEKASVTVAPIIFIVSKLFFPVVKLLAFSTHTINRMLGIKPPENIVTEEEIRQMIKLASTKGVIEEEQNVLHEKLFYFSDKKAKHIMTHRSEINWIDIHLVEEDFTNHLLACKTSKVLVCNKELDEYLGVLKIKEYLIKKMRNEEGPIQELLETPIVCPESADAQDILTEFRKKQTYFCVVIGEFGTVEGIITLHDVLENIVGELPEEEEVVEPDIVVLDDKSMVVNGDASIEVLAEVIENFEIDFEDIDYASVAGFVLDNIEKMPEVGDLFYFQGYRIEIIAVEHHRIEKILITKKVEE